MTEHDHDDDEADGDPAEAELLREILAIRANPTEDGVQRLFTMINHPSGMVRVRANATLLDIGYGPAEDEEPVDEEDP